MTTTPRQAFVDDEKFGAATPPMPAEHYKVRPVQEVLFGERPEPEELSSRDGFFEASLEAAQVESDRSGHLTLADIRKADAQRALNGSTTARIWRSHSGCGSYRSR